MATSGRFIGLNAPQRAALLIVILLVYCPVGQAQQRQPQAARNNQRTPAAPREVESPPVAGARSAGVSRRNVTFTPEREAAALTFVRINRPELLEVLERLKGSNEAEYQRAICDFFWTSETLAGLRQDDARAYELALRAWRLEAQTHFLASQLAARPSEAQALRDELEQTVQELVDAQIETSAYETRRLESQLRRAQDRHARLAQRREELVAERLAALSKAIGESKLQPQENP